MPMNTWYLLIDWQGTDGATNMARDAHLLELVDQGVLDRPILRVYFWDPPTLSLGFHQKWRQVFDSEALKAEGVGLVRRPTGGRVVLHEDEITYSIIAPTKEPFSSVISHNYRLIGEALQQFTNIAPSASELITHAKKETPDQRAHPCFASLSQSEIAAGHKKLVGSAQEVGKAAFLQHGSIPLKNRVDRLRRITGTDLNLDGVMTCLETVWHHQGMHLPDTKSLVEALVNSFCRSFHVHMIEMHETPYPDEDRVKAIAAQQFKSDAWTYRC